MFYLRDEPLPVGASLSLRKLLAWSRSVNEGLDGIPENDLECRIGDLHPHAHTESRDDEVGSPEGSRRAQIDASYDSGSDHADDLANDDVGDLNGVVTNSSLATGSRET